MTSPFRQGVTRPQARFDSRLLVIDLKHIIGAIDPGARAAYAVQQGQGGRSRKPLA
ncbi:MAG: hypothetical protein V4533_15060 [Pseudomonadota bacterium]|uniref:hypothetical protein n=1 Tax=Sphingobium sp. CECT 9361 TaxID=2845384 RepID=UPI001E2873A1|nr:hypothetical protein [Sphingobium sp. CECT 9361]